MRTLKEGLISKDVLKRIKHNDEVEPELVPDDIVKLENGEYMIVTRARINKELFLSADTPLGIHVISYKDYNGFIMSKHREYDIVEVWSLRKKVDIPDNLLDQEEIMNLRDKYYRKTWERK